MNVNVNLTPKNRKIKNILILLLFSLLCFFIKENVFALSVPDYLENYKDYTITCTNTDKGYSVCPDSQDHTFNAFVEYFIMLTHQYSIVMYDDFYQDYDLYFYFFSTTPYVEKNDNYISGEYAYSYYNFYDLPSKTQNSKFILLKCNSNTKYCSSPVFAHSIFNSPSTDTSLSSLVDDRIFAHFYQSNFDLTDIEDNSIFDKTSSGTVDWTDSKDIETDNRNWFEKLIDNIISIPVKVVNGISNFFKDLFIPDKEIFEDFINQEYEFLKEKLGFLLYPIDLIIDFSNRFYNISNSQNAVFTIPKIKFMNVVLFEENSIDLLSIVNSNDTIKNLYSIYRVFVSGLIVIWLCCLAKNKYDEIFGGGK